ncbi:MAG: methyltransferase domain-containing protein [Pseudomonadota bacterium]
MKNEYYQEKPADYFQGCREDFVSWMPEAGHDHVLEIGCAAGATGELALRIGKARQYVGVEISEAIAQTARDKLTTVHVGDVETMPLDYTPGTFDALVMSEVLEHLVDPWAVLTRLHGLLRPGAAVYASSPNISHHSMIRRLMAGDWTLEDRGAMDRTHLRWFTPKTYVQMFEDTGFAIDEVRPVTPFARRTRFLIGLSGGRMRHLFMRQICVRGRRL